MKKTVKDRSDYPSYIALNESGESKKEFTVHTHFWSPARSAPGNAGLTASKMNGVFAGLVSFR